MAFRVPGEFHEDKMRQHQAGPPPSQTRSNQAKPSQTKPSQAKPNQVKPGQADGMGMTLKVRMIIIWANITHAMPMHSAIIL